MRCSVQILYCAPPLSLLGEILRDLSNTLALMILHSFLERLVIYYTQRLVSYPHSLSLVETPCRPLLQ